MKLKIKKTNSNAIIPTKGSEYAAGYDLYACIPQQIMIGAGEVEKIGVGICAEIPTGFFGAVYPRSGLATKQGLRPANCVGVIDSDYRGEIIVALRNDSNSPRVIRNGDRIAQLVISPYAIIPIEEVEKLSDTERGDGGFGSTGISNNMAGTVQTVLLGNKE